MQVGNAAHVQNERSKCFDREGVIVSLGRTLITLRFSDKTECCFFPGELMEIEA